MASVRPAMLQLVVLRTSRMKKVLSFYRALGLAFVAEKHGKGPRHYACDLGGLVIEIYPRRPDEADGVQDGIMLGLRTRSIEEVLATLAAAGLVDAPPRPPSGTTRLLSANVRDPDGRKIMLTAG